MYKKIIVPLDGSKLAEGVLPHVRQLAHCLGCQIVLLQVLTHKSYDYLITDPGLAASLRSSEEEAACNYIGPLIKQLQQEGLDVAADVVAATGTVADVIIAFSHQAHGDLIAMSTHGRTGPARWMLGSVADRVVRGAGIPVLLIHPQSEREPGA
ncbi:MAG: universal stress protein [Caldilineales bacterium]|nr:universal stress protein [Caldilineales bacterium]MCW5858155.1 universal stress protein [Caldilineales bacterium]